MIASRERLISEKVADPAFIAFSYPNGSYTEEIAGMARDVGYHLAVTTQGGWNGPDTDPFELRRIAAHQDMTCTNAMLGARASEVF